MKNIIFILFLVSFTAFSQKVVENDSLLLWQSGRPLKWEDFKGPQLNHYGNVLAETHGEIKTVSCIWSNENIPIFEVAVFLDKNNSWTITDDLESLEHEQVHFNIFELFARKIRMKFSDLNKRKIKSVSVYRDTFDEYLEMNRKLQEEYEVDVLVNQDKQLEWKSKVAKELEELKEYEYIPEE